MTRLPRLKGKEIIRILERAGFLIVAQRQSYFPEASRRASNFVPVHSGETIGPGLLRAILRDVEMSVDDLLE